MEVTIWPRKDHSCLHHFLAGGIFSFRDVSPLAFPFCFEGFKERPQQSRWTLPNILNNYLFFKTSILILTRNPPFECVWMNQNYSTGYPRTGGCFQATTDGTLLYLAFLTCVSGHIGQTYTIGKPLCIPQPILETHVRNYCSSKPMSTHIKTPLSTQEPPCCWLNDHFGTNQLFLFIQLGQNEMLGFTGLFCSGLFCRRFKWLSTKMWWSSSNKNIQSALIYS